MDEARSESGRDAPVRRTRGDGGRREKLLETATREFAAKGLAGARVDAIARAARSNKQLVYYYFGNKIGLYNEVVGRIGPGVHEELYPDADDPSVPLVQRVRRRAMGPAARLGGARAGGQGHPARGGAPGLLARARPRDRRRAGARGDRPPLRSGDARARAARRRAHAA